VITHLFVYGTLQRGESRWPFLEPFVVDAGDVDSIAGRLFDTGLGYPAASVTRAPMSTSSTAAVARIHGHTFELARSTVDTALRTLDEVEGAVRGLYRRVDVITTAGVRAWVYEYGADPADHLDLTPLSGGDWLRRFS
jgi:gamma-glutamylcyclotransferase (GGCT)/AIG2-like uncharacterized protein YtfP